LGKLTGYIDKGCGLWDIAAAEVIRHEAGMVVETANVADGRYFIDARWPD
jgi:myo-inositol-1(or 4)-monophosphatase